MPAANNEAECFYENLVDIGLKEEVISQCVLLQKEGKDKQLLAVLKNSRKDLLNDIHIQQKRLDCLDYLVNLLSKKSRKEW